MRQNIVYVIFIMMIMAEKMIVLLGAFVFCYCLGYYSFEILKYKNRKEEIHEFFLSYNNKYGSQCGRSYENLGETKIANDIFSGKDLSNEQNFLNAVTETFGKELEHCEVSTYFE